mmetsp:Transcript_23678/g.73768  ORF Transcript_23678/g.73768 Transcript_23678/m.73768 type:complete len:331 (+) Transcript_23678:31-1023(+)
MNDCGRLVAGIGLGAALGVLGTLAWQSRKSVLRRAVLEHIARHRSIRSFERRPVAPELLDELLHTAMRSSNNGNMQTYSVIVTRDAAALERLALIHDNAKIATCGALVTFASDWSRHSRWCALSGGDPAAYDNLNAFLTGALDAMVTAQSFALAAEAAGLGICFLGSTIWEPDRLNAAFELPRGVHVVTSVMVGWPAEGPALRARLPHAAHVHEERYAPLSDAAVAAHYTAREAEGWARYKQLYGPAWSAKLESHGLRNLGQVYTTLKYSGQDFRLFSRRLLASIARQGFGRNAPTTADSAPCAVCGKWSHCLDPERLQDSGDVAQAYRE